MIELFEYVTAKPCVVSCANLFGQERRVETTWIRWRGDPKAERSE